MLKTGVEFDGYRILGHLGTGSMGQVYLARQLRLDRLVAIKLFAPQRGHMGKTNEEQLVAEARAAAALTHPGIIAMHDVGKAHIDGVSRAFLVMEYVDGEELQEVLDREPLLKAEVFHRVVRGVVDALTYAAQAGFTHRDIKPSNIMLSYDGRVKLADFGLAVRSGTHLQGDIVGTPKYLAPEQARGKRVDHRTDQYALGCVIYQLLTGIPPYEETDPHALLELHKYAPIPRASEAMDCDPRWSDLAFRLMSKTKDERFENPQELQAIVDALCADSSAQFSGHMLTSRRTLRRRQRRAVRRRPQPQRSPAQAGQRVSKRPVSHSTLPAADVESAAADREKFIDRGPSWWDRCCETIADRSLDLWDLVKVTGGWIAWQSWRVVCWLWALVLWCLPIIRQALHRCLPPLADLYLVMVAWTWRVRVVRGYDHVLSAADDGHAMLAGCSWGRHLPMVWWMALNPESKPGQRLYSHQWWGMVLRHLRWCFRLRGTSPRQRYRQAAALRLFWQAKTERMAVWNCPLDRQHRGRIDHDVIDAACAAEGRVFPIGISAEAAWLHRSTAEQKFVPLPWAQIVLAVGAPVPCGQHGDKGLLAMIIGQELEEMQDSADQIAQRGD